MQQEQSSGHKIFTAEVVAHLSRLGRVQAFSKGELIFRQSEPGSCMYIIEEGEVGLIFDQGKADKRLPRGSIFGELALLSGEQRRSATAIAASNCLLRVLDQSVFEELLEEKPKYLVILLRQACLYLLDSERRLMSSLLVKNRVLEQTHDYLRRTKEEVDSAEVIAQTDPLTGIYNRRCLDRQIVKYMKQAQKTGKGLALLIIDIDDFKEINDNQGHDIGDLVLKRFADHLRKAVRSYDLPFRLGGDEFGVVLPLVTEPEAISLCRKLLLTIRIITITLPHVNLRITACMGGTMYHSGENWEALFQRANKNLSLAQVSGRFHLKWDDKSF
ncbi:GGDEF domain-containing protein [candidate division CSSED10-310 bacterium]|uniref:GGDEF domain-containing protein n=1 Tax=candidate division CSSED10-310 bacterium TaxID=2855610 RepID=A0ABV6YRW8_UNCC1